MEVYNYEYRKNSLLEDKIRVADDKYLSESIYGVLQNMEVKAISLTSYTVLKETHSLIKKTDSNSGLRSRQVIGMIIAQNGYEI